MGKGMGSLDLRFMAREIAGRIEGGRARKIYQDGERFMIEFFVPNMTGLLESIGPSRQGTTGLLESIGQDRQGVSSTVRLHFDSKSIFISGKKEKAPEKPPEFCMLLRKHLEGKRIESIRQFGFDRILEIGFAENSLIIELIPPGNVILMDREGRIVMALKNKKWKDREIRRGLEYKRPSSPTSDAHLRGECHQDNPFEMDSEELGKKAAVSKAGGIGIFLAVDLGLGREYSDEVCFRAGLRGDDTLGKADFKGIASVLMEIDRENSPRLYGGKATPFEMKSMKSLPGFDGRVFSSFSEAIESIPEDGEKEGKGERIKKARKEAEERLEKEIEQKTRIAESFFTNYQKVKESLEKGVKTVELDGERVEIDPRKTLEANAARYFEEVKKARRKLEGLRRLEKIASKKTKKSRKMEEKAEWYHQFRWFFTSDGFLVIGGKNAEQNESIFKKHLEDKDWAFHADIPGGSLVVIKAESLPGYTHPGRESGKEIPAEAKKEAAEFAGAFSRAWERGIGLVDVYGVRAEQVSKKPPSGTFLPKGAFSISGEREWHKVEVRLGIGVKEGRMFSGAVEAVKKRAEAFAVIRPGGEGFEGKILEKLGPKAKAFGKEDVRKLAPYGKASLGQ